MRLVTIFLRGVNSLDEAGSALLPALRRMMGNPQPDRPVVRAVAADTRSQKLLDRAARPDGPRRPLGQVLAVLHAGYGEGAQCRDGYVDN